LCVCVCVHVRACVRACVHACVRAQKANSKDYTFIFLVSLVY